MTSRRNRIVDRPSTLSSAFANPAHLPSEEALRSTLRALDQDPGAARDRTVTVATAMATPDGREIMAHPGAPR